MLAVRLGRYVQRGCYALSVRAFSCFPVCSGHAPATYSAIN